MTAQKSTNNFLTNLLFRVKSEKKSLIVLLILHLVSAPLVLLNAISFINKDQKYFEKYGGSFSPTEEPPQFSEIYAGVAIFATAIAILCGILIALNIFNYLYKKSNVDMVLSLPMTTKTRFFSDFSAGLIVYLAPFLVSTIFTTILSFVYQGVYEKSHVFKDLPVGVIPLNFPELTFKILLFGFFVMVMIYVVTVLALTFCGSFFEALASTFYINILIPLGIFSGSIALFNDRFGIDATHDMMPTLYRTSPFGGLAYIYTYLKDSFNYQNESYTISRDYIFRHSFTSWLIPFIIVTVILFALSFINYSRRKAEDVSKPFVFKTFYYAIMTVISFIMVAMFYKSGDLTEYIIPLIIISALVWLIIEVITNRGFKKFWKAGIRYVAIMGSILGLALISQATDGFGVVYRVPDPSDVSYVTTSYVGAFESYDFRDYENIDLAVKLKDKASIKAVTEMHKFVLENHRNGVANSRYYRPIKIEYHLKNGITLAREYDIGEVEIEMLLQIDLTDEYIDGVMKNAKERIPSTTILEFSGISYSEEIKRLFIKKSQADELISALSKDLKNLTPEQYFTPKEKILYNFNFVDNFQFFITKDYVNTVAFLKSIGAKELCADFEITKMPFIQDVDIVTTRDVFLYNMINGVHNEWIGQPIILNWYTFASFIPGQNIFKKEITKDDLNEMSDMFSHLQPNYIIPKEDTTIKYLLIYMNFMYVIPPEFNDIAEKYLDYSSFKFN